MKNVGFIGWRGLVGSTLQQRIQAENNFQMFCTNFFSTSQPGQAAPSLPNASPTQLDAFNLDALMANDILVSCQGSDYTQRMYKKLRNAGWQGYWLDAASTLRLHEESIIVLDPVNQTQIDNALNRGVKTFTGGNCTVSLMLMAMAGLIQNNWVEWIDVATYQAVSGAGSQAVSELLNQITYLSTHMPSETGVLKAMQHAQQLTQRDTFPTQHLSAPLLNNVLPWIDTQGSDGQSREEWKGQIETNRILGKQHTPILVDSLCIRINALRCHSQAMTVKLNQDIPLADIESCLKQQHDWLTFIDNTPEQSLKNLTPNAVSQTLDIAVGRVRKAIMGSQYLRLFTVGDQLLWGAAEPLRRMLQQLV